MTVYSWEIHPEPWYARAGFELGRLVRQVEQLKSDMSRAVSDDARDNIEERLRRLAAERNALNNAVRDFKAKCERPEWVHVYEFKDGL